MLPEFRIATHPGQILLAEFLEPLRLTQAELARALGVTRNAVTLMEMEARPVVKTTELALKYLLSKKGGN